MPDLERTQLRPFSTKGETFGLLGNLIGVVLQRWTTERACDSPQRVFRFYNPVGCCNFTSLGTDVKLVVIYPRPKDVDVFEKIYQQEHVPIAVAKLGGKNPIAEEVTFTFSKTGNP